MTATDTAKGWDLVERRRSPDGRDFKCPSCGAWKDALLIRDDGGLTCWSCLKAERATKKGATDGDMADSTMP
ncbi:MAG: hypothetical protein HYX94_01040 [Chloroflexi bacterium]|nr:hypothetical protein [Chloroflexota bacterium]